MERKEFELQPGVILSKLDIKDGDAIIIAIDADIWGFDDASEICKIVSKMFPNNHVITTFKGIDISADRSYSKATSTARSQGDDNNDFRREICKI